MQQLFLKVAVWKTKKKIRQLMTRNCYKLDIDKSATVTANEEKKDQIELMLAKVCVIWFFGVCFVLVWFVFGMRPVFDINNYIYAL